MYILKDLINQAFEELLNAGYSYNTVYGSNWYIWNRLNKTYGENEIFSEDMVYEYCQNYFGRDIYSIDKSKLRDCEYRYISAFNNLIKVYKGIPLKKNNTHFHINQKLSHQTESVLNKYLEKCKLDGNSETTLSNKQTRIRNFIIDSNFDSINKDSLKEYLNRRKKEMGKTAYVIDMRLIRRFLVFCYEEHFISKELLLIWPSSFSSIADKSVPSVYTIDEIKQLLDSSKDFKYEDNHLRNYAILSLVVYSGMRANDVAHLKTSDLNWRMSEIKFIQQKTRKEQIIPLIPEIGNPIIEYIKSERKSSSQFLFTKENGEQMSSGMITHIIGNYFSNAPFDLKGRHYGAHALRHSLATQLINESVPPFTVANVLGHSSTECIHIYAKVDLIHLRKCILEAPYRA